jgi:hypothetical protein
MKVKKCANPACDNTFPIVFPRQAQKYCSKPCRKSVRKKHWLPKRTTCLICNDPIRLPNQFILCGRDSCARQQRSNTQKRWRRLHINAEAYRIYQREYHRRYRAMLRGERGRGNGLGEQTDKFRPRPRPRPKRIDYTPQTLAQLPPEKLIGAVNQILRGARS